VNLFNRDSAVNHSFADRTALVILLAAFGLSDAAAVGWSAGLVSGAEVLAGALSFVLIAFGAIFTAYTHCRVAYATWSGRTFRPGE
jgi:hypothetical protein